MEFAGALIDRTHQWCAESRFPIPVTLTYNRPNLPAGFAISSAEDMARTRLENSELLRVKDNAAFKRAITKLKDMPGKNIAVNSGEGTWRSFLKNDLWDGIDMLVHPC